MTVVPVQEASVLRRAVAGAIDLAISAALGAGLVAVLPGLVQEPWPERYWNLFDYAVDLVLHHPGLWMAPLGVFLAAMVLWEVLWTAILGAPPAARALGMEVRTRSGRRPGPLRALWRSLLWVAFSIPGAVGPAFALVGRRRRALHDILSGCLVVRLPVPARPRERTTPDETGSGDRTGPDDGRT